MMTSYVEESPTRRVLTFEVPVEEVVRVTEKTVRGLKQHLRLPGFRPGKVPEEMIRRRFAEEIKGEVVETLVQETVGAALREKNLVPLGKPEIEDLKFAFDTPLSFKVNLEVRPPVVPTDYRGLKVPSEPVEPTEAEVDEVLNRLREGHAAYEPIEGRPGADGDWALVDIKGSFPAGDGKDFEASKTLVEIGGEKTMPELSAHLRGAEPGGAFSFQKTFPSDSPDRAFAGKTVLYSVSLVALKRRSLPAVDDELARLVLGPGEGESPEEPTLTRLREKVGESVRRDKEELLGQKRRRAILDALLALHPVPAPESMIEAEVDSAVKEYGRALARQGVNLAEAGIDWNEVRRDARPSAERRVKEYLILDAIGDVEKVAVTDTELEAALKRRARAMGTNFGELKAALSKAGRLEAVREELRIERVIEFLIAESAPAA